MRDETAVAKHPLRRDKAAAAKHPPKQHDGKASAGQRGPSHPQPTRGRPSDMAAKHPPEQRGAITPLAAGMRGRPKRHGSKASARTEGGHHTLDNRHEGGARSDVEAKHPPKQTTAATSNMLDRTLRR
jgi:hypothetical protein